MIEYEKMDVLTLAKAKGVLKNRKQKVATVAKVNLIPSFDIVAEQPDEEEVNEENKSNRTVKSWSEIKETSKKRVKFISEPSECGES